MNTKICGGKNSGLFGLVGSCVLLDLIALLVSLLFRGGLWRSLAHGLGTMSLSDVLPCIFGRMRKLLLIVVDLLQAFVRFTSGVCQV